MKRPGIAGRGPRGRPGRAGGFTYVAVLAAVAVLGLGLAVIGPRWADAAQREREAELLRVGLLYAQALHSYHASSPGSVRQYPATLEALLEDPRHVGLYRHLRRLYADPMAPGQPWGLLRDAAGGIRGVYSTSERAPLRREALDLGVVRLPAAGRYRDWHSQPVADATPP